MIYACPRAVLSAGLAGETQHQLSRPIPRSPGIIPAVLTPDFSYRRAATVLSRNTITLHHPGEGTPQFLAILVRKLAGPAQARRGGSARARAEAGSGRRQARATASFFRPMAAFSGPTPCAFGQPTRRTAGAAPEMGQRSDAKSVTLPPGPGRATWAESVAPFRPSCGSGGGGPPAPPERCAASCSAWRRAVPERPGPHPRERPVLVVEDQIRGAFAGNRPSGPAPKAPVERCRDRRVGREAVRPDEFPGETIRGGRIVERRQFVRRRGVQPARAERGGDGREATGGQGPPKTNSPRHPGPQRGVPSGGWIRRTSSMTTRPPASGSSRPTNAGPLAVKAKKPAGEAAGRAWRRSR